MSIVPQGFKPASCHTRLALKVTEHFFKVETTYLLFLSAFCLTLILLAYNCQSQVNFYRFHITYNILCTATSETDWKSVPGAAPTFWREFETLISDAIQIQSLRGRI